MPNFESMSEMEEFFRKTGSQGGKKRMAKLTKAQRSELGRMAAAARWKKAKTKKKAAGKKAN